MMSTGPDSRRVSFGTMGPGMVQREEVNSVGRAPQRFIGHVLMVSDGLVSPRVPCLDDTKWARLQCWTRANDVDGA